MLLRQLFFTMPLRRRIVVIIVSILQSMKLRLGRAELFAWSDLQSWDQTLEHLVSPVKWRSVSVQPITG